MSSRGDRDDFRSVPHPVKCGEIRGTFTPFDKPVRTKLPP
jgi:hypothetical protein